MTLKKYLSIFPITVTILYSNNIFGAYAIKGHSNNIQFTGNITDSSCNLSVKDNGDKIINLGNWSKANFKKPGDTSESIHLIIELTDCKAGKYNLHFITASDPRNENLLKIDGTKDLGVILAKILDSVHLYNFVILVILFFILLWRYPTIG